MNLNEIYKKHDLWVRYALKLTGNNFDADDLVSEMYLKMGKINKPCNDFYIFMALKSIFYDSKKKKNIVSYLENNELEYFDHFVEDNNMVDDEEADLIESIEKLPFHQKELLIEYRVNKKSYREIQREFNINYGFVFREIKKAEKKLLK